MNFKQIHRINATFLLAFMLLHIGNHLFALSGPDAHIKAMEWLRAFYRNPVVEPLLLLSVAFQVYSGLHLFWRRRRTAKMPVAKLQLVSGAYLAFFLVVHVSAVLGGRILLGLDTNFWFAAAGYQAGYWNLFFAPYYFLAILSLFVHLSCAAWWLVGGKKNPRSNVVLFCISLIGLLVSIAISVSMMGLLEPFVVPTIYLQTFDW